MGDGIALAVDQLRASKPAHRAIVVCGDGDSNWIIRYSDDDAAALAKSLGIPIFAIAVGDNSKGSDVLGAMAVETAALSRIAATTRGAFYEAADAAAFDRAFVDIGKRLDALAAAM